MQRVFRSIQSFHVQYQEFQIDFYEHKKQPEFPLDELGSVWRNKIRQENNLLDGITFHFEIQYQ